MKAIPLILFTITLAMAGQICLKFGMNEIGRSGLTAMLTKMAISPIILTGLTFYAVSAVFWMIVLSRVDLSYAYPFLGLTFVGMMFLTKFIFHEDINIWRWAGTAMIFIGVVVSARQ